MDTGIIVGLIREGKPMRELKREVGYAVLSMQTSKAYVAFGVQRGQNGGSLADDLRSLVSMLYTDVMEDKAYAELRDKEIPYIFSEGLKGRLSKTQDFSVNYKTIVGWMESYVNHQCYKDAVKEYQESLEPKPVALIEARKTLTDEQMRDWVLGTYADFVEWKEERKKLLAKPVPRYLQTIGESSPYPPTMTAGLYLKTDFLRKMGVQGEKESLVACFERLYRSGEGLKL